jgi:ferredoxin
MSKTDDSADIMFYHMTRLIHLAGRCTGCGACVRGCPMNVDLQLYNDKLRKAARERFGFDAGMDPGAEPPLSCYRAEDEDNFVM